MTGSMSMRYPKADAGHRQGVQRRDHRRDASRASESCACRERRRGVRPPAISWTTRIGWVQLGQRPRLSGQDRGGLSSGQIIEVKLTEAVEETRSLIAKPAVDRCQVRHWSPGPARRCRVCDRPPRRSDPLLRLLARARIPRNAVHRDRPVHVIERNEGEPLLYCKPRWIKQGTSTETALLPNSSRIW